MNSASVRSKGKAAQLLALALLFGALWCSSASGQVSTLVLNGSYGPYMELSAGQTSAGGGHNAAISTQTTGGSAAGQLPDRADFSASVDFGDLSKGDGTPCAAMVGLRIRSNTSFKLVCSLASFQVSGIRYQGKELDSSDGGSFVKIWSGPLNSTGANAASPGQVSLSANFAAGMTLSALARGPATDAGTVICSGPIASAGGGPASPDNAVDVPVYLAVPTGYELGPSEQTSEGSFSFAIQFGLLPGP